MVAVALDRELKDARAARGNNHLYSMALVVDASSANPRIELIQVI